MDWIQFFFSKIGWAQSAQLLAHSWGEMGIYDFSEKISAKVKHKRLCSGFLNTITITTRIFFRTVIYSHNKYAYIHIYMFMQDTYWRNKLIRRTLDFFIKIFTSHFIVRVRKGCVGFYCERELETEHKL